MKEVAKLGVTLMLICAVAGLGLAVVYAATKPVIEQRAKDDMLKAVKEVLPGASEIEEQQKDGQAYWLGKDGSTVVGAAMYLESKGFGQSPMKLIVGVDKTGKITKVSILELSETPGIGSRVNSPEFLSKFSGVEDPSKVDGISGATFSSRAVIGGASKASSFLRAIVAPKEEPKPIDLKTIPDGTYQGVANGLMGPIKVSVTVKGGKITAVEVLENSETPAIAGKALKDIPASIVSSQKVDVDTVSGATYTSKGIIEAVRNALAGKGK